VDDERASRMKLRILPVYNQQVLNDERTNAQYNNNNNNNTNNNNNNNNKNIITIIIIIIIIIIIEIE